MFGQTTNSFLETGGKAPINDKLGDTISCVTELGHQIYGEVVETHPYHVRSQIFPSNGSYSLSLKTKVRTEKNKLITLITNKNEGEYTL